MRGRISRIAVGIFGAATLASITITADAVPVFARRYGTSCTTCHAPMPPKLSNFGQAFKDNGLRMPVDDEFFIKTPDQKLGADAWKDVFPNTVWPGAIPAEAPLGIRLDFTSRLVRPGAEIGGHHGAPAQEPDTHDDEPDAHDDGAADEDDGHDDMADMDDPSRRLEFEFPSQIGFMIAGTAGTHVSYWSMLFTNGAGEVGVHEAWGQLDNLLDTTLLNVRLGKFEPRLHGFTSNRTFTDVGYLTGEFASTIGGEKRQAVLASQAGVELWGVKSIKATGGGLQYSVGALSGGLGEAEVNGAKDVYARVAYKYGGRGTGKSLEDSYTLKTDGNWIDDSVRLGAFAYSGSWGEDEFDFTRAGADIDAWYKNLNLYGSLVLGSDDGVLDTGHIGSVESTTWSVGADWVAYPWLIPTVRVEGASWDEPDGHADEKPSFTRVVPSLTVGLRPNVTWLFEAALHGGDKGERSDYGTSRFSVMF